MTKLSARCEAVKSCSGGCVSRRSLQALDTNAFATVGSVAAARSTRAAASPLHQIPNAFGTVSPEGFNLQRLLEGEIQTATEHSEVVLRTVDYAEAQIISPTK